MKNKKKIVIFGCKNTTLILSEFLKKNNYEILLITINIKDSKKYQIAGYMNLHNKKNLFSNVYFVKNYSLSNKSDFEFFQKHKKYFDVAFVAGWQRLIPKNILDLFKYGVFGMHGSARNLPLGKGRSPMNWALIEGRKTFTTNLFKYDSGIDSGPVVASNIFSIQEADTAETLHYKNTLSMISLIKENISTIVSGKIITLTQNLNLGESYYPKRSPEDGLIDWKDDIYSIERLIRAVAPPFHGAFTYLNKKKITINRASIFYTDIENHPYREKKFGEVCKVFPNNKFLVKCSGGIILIHEFEGKKLNEGNLLFSEINPFQKFKRNQYGFFDV